MRTEVTRGQGQMGKGRSGRIGHTTAEKELGDRAVCGQDRVNRTKRSCVAQSLTWAACFCSIVSRGPAGECPDDDVTSLPLFPGLWGEGQRKDEILRPRTGRSHPRCVGVPGAELTRVTWPVSQPGPLGGHLGGGSSVRSPGPGHLLRADRGKVWLSPAGWGGTWGD